MRCLLVAVASNNNNIEKNKNRMINLMKQYSGQADILLFGEAYLQGFYAMEFNYDEDSKKAIYLDNDAISDNAAIMNETVISDNSVIHEITKAAADNKIAVSFGFFEKAEGKIYSSQITISSEGKIIDLYRRVSPGWKEPDADGHYAEGESFHTFCYLGQKILVGICGDLWDNANIAAIRELDPDVVFWPVYTDFNVEKWNTVLKSEYAKQVKDIPAVALYVNSVCMDQEGEDLAKGGAAVFYEGEIVQEVPAGSEQMLLIKVDSYVGVHATLSEEELFEKLRIAKEHSKQGKQSEAKAVIADIRSKYEL